MKKIKLFKVLCIIITLFLALQTFSFAFTEKAIIDHDHLLSEYYPDCLDFETKEISKKVLEEKDLPFNISIKEATKKGHVERLYQEETDLSTVVF